MAGQPHQFPGFTNNPTGAGMRSNFTAGPMQTSMTNQLTGVMGGGMSPAGMSGMGGQMVQSQYVTTGMGGQMGALPGMTSQGMVVGSATSSPNQSMSGMSSTMCTTPSNTNHNNMLTNTMSSNTNMALSSGAAPGAVGGAPGAGGNATSTNITSQAGSAGGTVPGQTQQGGAQASSITQGAATTPSATNQSSTQPQQNKEFNTASLCRFGQETVQDIVSRTQEVFQTLKAIHPPNGTPPSLVSSNEKKAKIQEQLRTIRLLFKRLRLIYEKCNENCQVPGMEYTHIESLIPLKDDYEHNKTIDEKKTSENYRIVCEENRELTEQVVLKNKHLMEIIFNLRAIIWQINVMLNMRKT